MVTPNVHKYKCFETILLTQRFDADKSLDQSHRMLQKQMKNTSFPTILNHADNHSSWIPDEEEEGVVWVVCRLEWPGLEAYTVRGVPH